MINPEEIKKILLSLPAFKTFTPEQIRLLVADRFLSTITIMGGQLRKNDLDYFARVVAYQTELADETIHLETMKDALREICLLLREVNESLWILIPDEHETLLNH